VARPGKKGVNPGGALSTHEASTVLGISSPTLLKLLKEKKIPEPQKVSGARIWTAADVRHAQLVIRDLHEDGSLRRIKGGGAG
jgi:excisionase family DNA binding protein